MQMICCVEGCNKEASAIVKVHPEDSAVNTWGADKEGSVLLYYCKEHIQHFLAESGVYGYHLRKASKEKIEQLIEENLT